MFIIVIALLEYVGIYLLEPAVSSEFFYQTYLWFDYGLQPLAFVSIINGRVIKFIITGNKSIFPWRSNA